MLLGRIGSVGCVVGLEVFKVVGELLVGVLFFGVLFDDGVSGGWVELFVVGVVCLGGVVGLGLGEVGGFVVGLRLGWVKWSGSGLRVVRYGWGLELDIFMGWVVEWMVGLC